MLDNLLKFAVVGMVVIALLLGLKLVAGEICLVGDWHCTITRYEARVEACMETDRLTLDECRWLAVND